MASPFAPPPSAGLCVSTEISLIHAFIDSLQGELARLRGSSAVGSGANWRRIDVRVAAFQEVQVGRRWQHAILGFDFRCRCTWMRKFWFVDFSQEVWTRFVPVYGLRGVRVGGASSRTGYTRRGSQGAQVVSSRTRRGWFFALSSDIGCEMETASAQPRSMGSAQDPQSQ